MKIVIYLNLISSLMIAPAINAYANDNGFTDAQTKAIGEIASDYIIKNPYIFEMMVTSAQTEKMKAQQAKMKAKILENQSELLTDNSTPSYGPKNPSANAIIFFDYQCIYCARLSSVMKELMNKNKDVRFIFKEWPIFGARWPNSITAAEMGINIWRQKGSDSYVKYHEELFMSGRTGGNLTDADIAMAASHVHFNKNGIGNAKNEIDRNNSLATKIGFQGTPSVIIMPSHNAINENITVFSGLTSIEKLQSAVDLAVGVVK
ncbi:DsbA family protein [Enterobacter asburiae]|uniref:DsbA family protein n=1 Tax=Enterobacter asburiae TaxID=61645 RepID=UPI00192AFC7A|nr:DsbA family protein [Enterobacter asburiae]MBL5841379.1 thioredoxin domain-containing protein [Enterobacter asburiae]MBL5941727.1 thioredoxin domain-containing protein [Enterobacter asburiae]MBL5963527.1 thioredoxin domain-containing protein [Enterobacter asburiae]MBL5972176.1 thioredoxin domain-containing protein [Enterobacter asburiae]